MSLTTIPLQQETRNKLRELANKSESWDAILRRLYENEITRRNAQVFFSADTLSTQEALDEIDKW
ncbi:hypothetical protein K9M74_04995 [Candidatus Woesearchaeota archaeon]|nr:hypothetical protein [Candidatus Woesearchaeota archaeon]